jgi:hypothetical protein
MKRCPGTTVELAKPTFRLDVAVRDSDVKKLADRTDIYATIADPLNTLLQTGLSISDDELFGSAICQELGDVDGRRTRSELAGRVSALRLFVSRDLPRADGPLVLTGKPGEGVVEYLGVGVGLTLVDRLFALDSSYFRRIPELRGNGNKTLDFEGCFRASTGSFFLQIETKGRTDSNSLVSAWKDIDAKKAAFRGGVAPARPLGVPLPAVAPTYLVGTVTEIPFRRSGPSRVVIGDPPIPSFDGDPQRARLLQRLRFYQRALSVFYPRGALLAALSERIGNLERPRTEWQVYDRQPILNSRLEKWELGAAIATTVRISSDDQIHGRSVYSPKALREQGLWQASAASPSFFFIGLHRAVLRALARQDFEQISDARYPQRYIRAAINGAERTLFQLHSGLVLSSLMDSL